MPLHSARIRRKHLAVRRGPPTGRSSGSLYFSPHRDSVVIDRRGASIPDKLRRTVAFARIGLSRVVCFRYIICGVKYLMRKHSLRISISKCGEWCHEFELSSCIRSQSGNHISIFTDYHCASFRKPFRYRENRIENMIDIVSYCCLLSASRFYIILSVWQH